MAEITFTGNLGADAETRYTQSGVAAVSFRVADSKSKKLDNGEWETIAEQWLNVTLWGDLGEFLAPKLVKGARVKVVGEFYVREFEHNGQTRQSLDVRAWGVDVFQKQGSGGGQRRQPSQQGGQQQRGAAADPWGAPSGKSDPWAQPSTTEAPF